MHLNLNTFLQIQHILCCKRERNFLFIYCQEKNQRTRKQKNESRWATINCVIDGDDDDGSKGGRRRCLCQKQQLIPLSCKQWRLRCLHNFESIIFIWEKSQLRFFVDTRKREGSEKKERSPTAAVVTLWTSLKDRYCKGKWSSVKNKIFISSVQRCLNLEDMH